MSLALFLNFYITRVIQFIPLSCFVVSYRITNDWYCAFMSGGCVAIAQSLLFIHKGISPNRFLLAVNFFLVGGAIGMLFDIDAILDFYENFLQATLFIWLLVVGIITTIFSPRGFIDVEHVQRKLVFIHSIYFLGGVLVAGGISFFFKGDFILAGMLPFIGLKVLEYFLKKSLACNA